jgi:voltage-gated potassium channel
MEENKDHGVGVWQLVMLGLCVYVLIALFVMESFTLPSETQKLMGYVDTAVCFVFLADFFVQLATAKSKLGYLKWGWIDLISSIPSAPILRVGRLARMVRILRILRGLRSLRVIVGFLFKNRAKGVFASAGLIAFVLMIMASIVVLNYEKDTGNIKTAGEAIWWAFSTITTVGYGDFYPTTTVGRLAGAALMTVGVGLFGIFTAFLATIFMEPAEQVDQRRDKEILEELKGIRKRLDEMEKK